MLRPTFLGFETAKRGIAASQKGLDITGHNMTNWDSPGYTRQRIDQVSVAPGAYTSRFASNRIGVAGQGVDISGISQTRDSFLDKRYREEFGDVGYNDQAKTILADIESALGEFDPANDSGIRGSLLSMFKALQNFSGNPYSETHANIVCTEFKNITQILHQFDTKLTSVADQQKYDLKISVNEVNKKLEQIAELNKTISEDLGVIGNDSRYGPNELLDQRNLLLDELSQYADLNVGNNADGTVTVKMNDRTVVSGGKHETIGMSEDEYSGTVALRWVSDGTKVNFTTGSLKASTDFLNGRGPNVKNEGETAFRGVLYYRDKLNTFANTLVNTVNNVIPDGDTGGFKQLMGALSTVPDADGKFHVRTDVPVTAANISISDAWSANANYVIYESDSKDNNYALKLSNALVQDQQTFLSNGEVFTGTMLEYVDNYAATLGEDYSFYESRHTSTATIANELQDRRDEVAGVVVDEEVANVMLYNKSLAAASRLMTALDEALDVIINKTGLVGR